MIVKKFKFNGNIVVVGLGYVGLPIAISFAKKFPVIGFDYNEKKIDLLKKGIDLTNEVGHEELAKTNIKFTSNPEEIKNGDFIIVAVPTPIDNCNNPDLSCIIKASEYVGQNIKKVFQHY